MTRAGQKRDWAYWNGDGSGEERPPDEGQGIPFLEVKQEGHPSESPWLGAKGVSPLLGDLCAILVAQRAWHVQG